MTFAEIMSNGADMAFARGGGRTYKRSVILAYVGRREYMRENPHKVVKWPS